MGLKNPTADLVPQREASSVKQANQLHVPVNYHVVCLIPWELTLERAVDPKFRARWCCLSPGERWSQRKNRHFVVWSLRSPLGLAGPSTPGKRSAVIDCGSTTVQISVCPELVSHLTFTSTSGTKRMQIQHTSIFSPTCWAKRAWGSVRRWI